MLGLCPLEPSRVMCMCNPMTAALGREMCLCTFNSCNSISQDLEDCLNIPKPLLQPIRWLNKLQITFHFSHRSLCLSVALTYVLGCLLGYFFSGILAQDHHENSSWFKLVSVSLALTIMSLTSKTCFVLIS